MYITKLSILFIALLLTAVSAQVFQLEWDYPAAIGFVGDIDNDGIDEFVEGDNNELRFYDVPTKTLKYTTSLSQPGYIFDDQMLVTYSHHQDYNNNGSIDLAFDTEWIGGTKIWILDVVTNQELFSIDSSSYDIVADIDKDQLLEIVIYRWSSNFDIHTLVYGTNVPVTGLIAENPKTQPKSFQLKQNYPNPFNPSTTIKWEQSHVADVEITIYDNLGRKVKTLLSERKPFGTHTTLWDGTDRQGKTVASGNYFYEVSFDGKKEARKMILIK